MIDLTPMAATEAAVNTGELGAAPRVAPWAGLSTSVRTRSAAEAVSIGKLDWTVQTAPLYYGINVNPADNTPGGYAEVRNKVAAVRSDDGSYIATVGRKMHFIDNADALAVMDPIAELTGGEYNSIGVIGNGRKVWIQLRLPNDIFVTDSDAVEKYLLWANANDGSMNAKMFLTPQRVSCLNTLNVALKGFTVSNGLSIKHTGDVDKKMENARNVIGLVTAHYTRLADIFRKMVATQLNRAQLDTVIDRVMPKTMDDAGTDATGARSAKARMMVDHLMHYGRGNELPGVRGTAWAAWNGFTEYFDHNRPQRGGTALDRRSRNLESVWWGSAAYRKQRAFDVVNEVAGIDTLAEMSAS